MATSSVAAATTNMTTLSSLFTSLATALTSIASVSTTITPLATTTNLTSTDYDLEYSGDDIDYEYAAPCEKKNTIALAANMVPALYLLVFLFGLLGNLLVVVILLKYMKLKTTTNLYLINLAISDLLFIFTLPFWIHYIGVYQDWVFGMPMCKVLMGLCYTALYSEIFFIILLTIDRYLSIVYAVSAIKARTVTFAIISSVLAWFLAGMVAVPEFVYHGFEDDHGVHCDPYFPEASTKTWKNTHVVKINTLSLVLPLLIMVICYWGIIKKLLTRPSKKKHKAIRLIFVIMLLYFVFWTPYNVVLFLSTFQATFLGAGCELSKQLDMALLVSKTLAYTHCCINPVIYAFVGEKFRIYLYKFFNTYIATYFCKYIPFLAVNEGKEGPTRI
uniref:E1 n=1 Tax=Equid gammaherpesvirus 2 TaxID=12657 RepID=A3F194_9GAMA|nr:E1 variant b [Equid gammaherpesvirus 2]ABN14184.1 E1 variant b [Equid gammaherpesvirus 2]ABN14185.1 E1 variant b [Equid gammaherpesvirus 2]ABN14186.1 E1 [Equid gammaherpesvirus 2]ABN14187.1 E1 [Equid gammaherpesvirus 2]